LLESLSRSPLVALLERLNAGFHRSDESCCDSVLPNHVRVLIGDITVG